MKQKLSKAILGTCLFFFSILVFTGFLQAQNIVIKAGHLFESRTGKTLNDQTIIIKNGKIQEIGSNLKYKSTDTIIDLSKSWFFPG
jgi:imidazolonepropionase-like amidohydrolase